jgi:transaldolase/glucose-6-phosphate isomerase
MELVDVQTANPLRALHRIGQSIWLDSISRQLIASSELKHIIDNDGLRGVTSNPAIFEHAIRGSADYAATLEALESSGDQDAKALYEGLAIADVRDAADVMRPVYEATAKRDGYVSLEVSPYLAHKTEETVLEARRLWGAVDRPNLMIKVPATAQGIPAIRQLISEGINVNVTLLFSIDAYEAVSDAYLSGLETFLRTAAGRDRIGGVASVASFFVSRIDTVIDGLLRRRLEDPDIDRYQRRVLEALRGTVAVANAKLAYQSYQRMIASQRWKYLGDRGAQTQRLLWASTGTKDPAYSDVKYVAELIGPDTVNTVPPATLAAFRDHGSAHPTLTENVDEARHIMETLENIGISLTEVTDRLLVDGVRLFADAFDRLLGAVEQERVSMLAAALNRQSVSLPEPLASALPKSLDQWRAAGNVRRLWAGDASLWTGTDEKTWLGWLDIARHQLAQVEGLVALAREMKDAGFADAVLLGMGGSSLCPAVMRATFGTVPGFARLHVLDSTDPAQIQACEEHIDLLNTIFIVSSKSGSTLEPNILKEYFFERVRIAGLGNATGSRFIAITDPGSALEQVATRDGFRHIYHGTSSIGGRYSALSAFGTVPSVVMGLDVKQLLTSAELMVRSCGPSVPPDQNPGVVLGTVLGLSAQQGRDKLTFVVAPELSELGAWLEQLVAESTGKQGKGIIPVDGEQLGDPSLYGTDRVFVQIGLAGQTDGGADARLAALERAGHPVVRIVVSDRMALGQEFFRWEMATAVAGAIIAINPFDQPDVEASKVATRKLTDEYEQAGHLPGDSSARPSVDDLRTHLESLRPGDYFALLAYVEMSDEHCDRLQRIRHLVRDRKHVATCLGFGPRFLHSTGQAYKGGPDSGVFLQVTCEDAEDLPVPGRRYTFGVVKAAQALGDFAVLKERGRRALHVHLGADVRQGLTELCEAIEQALDSRRV